MISVILPTLNAADQAGRITDALQRQSLVPGEVIVIDSQSSDGTVEAFRKGGARVEMVERASFHHATARNSGAAFATGDVLVFMTQDALPMDEFCLERLVAPLTDGQAAASFARQTPRPDASPLERFAREVNYPEQSRLTREADIALLGVRAFFFSNSFSAIRRDAFVGLGGFPHYTIMNEDMVFAARMLRAGHAISYSADALVEHSHRYTLPQTFRRYFDIGVVFTQAQAELATPSLNGEGSRYVGKLLTRLIRDGNYHWIPMAVAESAAKLAGLTLGRRYHRLPLSWTKHVSMHPNYWTHRR